MESVRQLLDKKGHEVWSVHPDDSVFDAVKKMADKNIGSLVVLVDDQIVGIITERHYAQHVILMKELLNKVCLLTNGNKK